MSHFSGDDEAVIQSMLRQLLQSVKEKLRGAPSVECAEEILLHLEETDEHFHNSKPLGRNRHTNVYINKYAAGAHFNVLNRIEQFALFKRYEFVKYLRHYIKNSLGSVIEEETERCTVAQSRGEASGYDTLVQHVTKKTRESKEYRDMMNSLKNVMVVVVDSLINKFEDDQVRSKETQKKSQRKQHSGHYTDNCSDSDSSFNQSYSFMNQEQLRVIAERLDPNSPKEVRLEALQTLCSAPPSDALNSESWATLRKNLTVSLADPDTAFTEKILKFYAKTFSSSPLNMTREVYTSLAKHLELCFLSGENHIPTLSSGVDIHNPAIVCLLKKVRLLNEYQREVPAFWIRHSEKYMEEVVESTLSLLSITREANLHTPQKPLDPIYFLALIDIKAIWFKKWMIFQASPTSSFISRTTVSSSFQGYLVSDSYRAQLVQSPNYREHAYYSRTVVLRLLEKKYNALIITAVQQCFHYFECCKQEGDESTRISIMKQSFSNKKSAYYTGKELQYILFVHSLCLLGRMLIYTHGRKLFPIKLKTRKEKVSLTDLLVLFINIMYYSRTFSKKTLTIHTGVYSPASLVIDTLRILCDRKECATECLYTSAVVDALLLPIHNILEGKKVNLNCDENTLTYIADLLARIASIDKGLCLLLYGEKNNSSKESLKGAHTLAQFTKKLLREDISVFSDSEMVPVLKGAFIFACRQMYNTCEGLQVLMEYGLHQAISEAWKQTSAISERIPTPVAGEVSSSSVNQEIQSSLLWEESLLDNLLNFAATPRGLLLLQQTGAINECVTYMFSRFTQKLQVSRCEKFGYGVMVTQVAATSPGAVALHSSEMERVMVEDTQ